MWFKKAIFPLLVISFVVSEIPAGATEFLAYDPYSSDEEEGLNLKDFAKGESFYLWTTFSVKVT